MKTKTENKVAQLNHKIDRLIRQINDARDAGMKTGRLEAAVRDLDDQVTAIYRDAGQVN
jgi:predicted  nucleic acid-binding Zn-ribbon protein